MRKHSTKYYERMDTIWKKDIIKLYKKGRTLKEIADKYNVGKETIRQRLIRWGVKIRKYTSSEGPVNKRLEKLKGPILHDYMRNGLSLSRLAGRYKFDHLTLTNKIKDWGYFDPSGPNRRRNFKKYHLDHSKYRNWNVKQK